jgi:hypothetical protein
VESLPKNSTQANTRVRVRQMLDQGFTVRQIALVLNLTTQRIYQIKAELEAAPNEASA